MQLFCFMILPYPVLGIGYPQRMRYFFGTISYKKTACSYNKHTTFRSIGVASRVSLCNHQTPIIMKLYILVSALFLFLPFRCNDNPPDPPPATPTYTLTVHGRDNCILLNTSVAVPTGISPGSFPVTVSGDAFFAPGASHKNVFLRYSGSDDDHLAMLPIGGTRTLGLRAGKMFAFFADWSDINDNSGDAFVSFGNTSITVNGKDNCIFLDNSVAARTTIPAGVYKVKVTGNAYFAPDATHYDVLVRYAGTADDELDILPIGGEKTLSLRNGYGFYAFFADWDNIDDNSGTVTLEFYKQ